MLIEFGLKIKKARKSGLLSGSTID